jgi:hypothetical protein
LQVSASSAKAALAAAAGRGESRINGNNCFGIHKDFLIVLAGKAPGEK